MVATLHKEFMENRERDRERFTRVQRQSAILNRLPSHMTSAVTRHDPISSGITHNSP